MHKNKLKPNAKVYLVHWPDGTAEVFADRKEAQGAYRARAQRDHVTDAGKTVYVSTALTRTRENEWPFCWTRAAVRKAFDVPANIDDDASPPIRVVHWRNAAMSKNHITIDGTRSVCGRLLKRNRRYVDAAVTCPRCLTNARKLQVVTLNRASKYTSKHLTLNGQHTLCGYAKQKGFFVYDGPATCPTCKNMAAQRGLPAVRIADAVPE